MARVPTKLKLTEILRKMLTANMDMRSANRALHQGPEAFDALGMVFAVRPLLCAMVYGSVKVAEARELCIRQQFVSRNRRPLFNVFDDVRLKRVTADIWNNTRDHGSVALNHAENDCLARSAATTFSAASLPTDHRFVGLHMAAQLVVAVDPREIFADFMAHAPRCLIGDAQLALQFLRRNAVARRGEQIHREKPLLERDTRSAERRSNHRMNMMAAVARIGGHFGELAKFPNLATTLALQVLAIPLFEKMRQTGVIILELGEELLNRDRHAYLHCGDYRIPSYIRQADNHLLFI